MIRGMIPNDLTLQHERVDDIPLLFGLMEKLNLPAVLEQGLGSHHFHQGLSNGLLTCGWLSFILSQGSHCKYALSPWVVRRHWGRVEFGMTPYFMVNEEALDRTPPEVRQYLRFLRRRIQE